MGVTQKSRSLPIEVVFVILASDSNKKNKNFKHIERIIKKKKFVFQSVRVQTSFEQTSTSLGICCRELHNSDDHMFSLRSTFCTKNEYIFNPHSIESVLFFNEFYRMKGKYLIWNWMKRLMRNSIIQFKCFITQNMRHFIANEE